jgi:hypothetical protein
MPPFFLGRPYHHQPDEPFFCDFGHGMQQVIEPLERDIGTVGDDDASRFPLDVGNGVEQTGVDAVGHHGKTFPRDPEIPGNVLPCTFGNGDDAAQGARHPFLHADEGEPAQVLELFPEWAHRTHGDVPVHRNGVVNGGHGGDFLGDGPDAVGEALVVVNDVIVLHPVSQKTLGADAEGERLGKTHGGDPRPLHDIDRIRQFFQGGDPEQVVRIVKVQAGEPVDGDVRIQHGVRRTGYDVDTVADIRQCPAQVFQVNALTTAVGVAPVAQQADVEGSIQTAIDKHRSGHLSH